MSGENEEVSGQWWSADVLPMRTLGVKPQNSKIHLPTFVFIKIDTDAALSGMFLVFFLCVFFLRG